jgi:Phosphoglycerate dehydrogenase and related dehydrogenases
MNHTIPAKPLVGIAHVTYRLADVFAERSVNFRYFEVRTQADLHGRLGEIDMLLVSGLWDNNMLAAAPRLRFIQAISSGVENFDLGALAQRGVALANGRGVNARAVAEHAMALTLSLTRQLHLARDRQSAGLWRDLIGSRDQRETELGGKTMLVVGAGTIGTTLGRIARQGFGMRTIGLRRQPSTSDAFDAVVTRSGLTSALGTADIVVLTAPLTPETRGMIGQAEFGAMRPDAILVNVGRGGLIDERALLATLRAGNLRGVGLDCFEQEPLGTNSPLWGIPRVVITPHTAGESSRYEDRIADLFLGNLQRLRQGLPLENAIFQPGLNHPG